MHFSSSMNENDPRSIASFIVERKILSSSRESEEDKFKKKESFFFGIRATKWLFYFTPGFELYTTFLLPLFLFYNEAKLFLLFHLCVYWLTQHWWKIASKRFFCGSPLIESRLISFKSNIPFDVSFLAFKKESYRKIVLIILRINREEESSRMFLFIIF